MPFWKLEKGNNLQGLKRIHSLIGQVWFFVFYINSSSKQEEWGMLEGTLLLKPVAWLHLFVFATTMNLLASVILVLKNRGKWCWECSLESAKFFSWLQQCSGIWPKPFKTAQNICFTNEGLQGFWTSVLWEGMNLCNSSNFWFANSLTHLALSAH